jgi:hypothetical protein
VQVGAPTQLHDSDWLPVIYVTATEAVRTHRASKLQMVPPDVSAEVVACVVPNQSKVRPARNHQTGQLMRTCLRAMSSDQEHTDQSANSFGERFTISAGNASLTLAEFSHLMILHACSTRSLSAPHVGHAYASGSLLGSNVHCWFSTACVQARLRG